MAVMWEAGLRESSGGVKALQGQEMEHDGQWVVLTTKDVDGKEYVNRIPVVNVAYLSSMFWKEDGGGESV